jgi:DNA repair exonuclease SbcCD ATPase subunit
LMNTVNEKDLVTEIEFSIGKTEWKVRRGIKPALFEIYSNGNIINQDAKSTDYQKYLEDKVLKLNFKSFTQIVVLGSSSFVPFMQLSSNDRRVIIEDILDIGIFSVMKNLLKDRSASLKEELSEIEYNIKLLQEKINLHEKHLQEMKAKTDTKRKSDLDKMEETQKEIIKLNDDIENHQDLVMSLMRSIEDSTTAYKKNTELDKYKSQINKNLKKLNKDKSFYEKNQICPTCQQDILENFKKHKCDDISDDIEEMNDGLDKIETEIENVCNRLEEISVCNKKIQTEENEIRTKNGYIKSHNRFITHLNEELNKKDEIVDENKQDFLTKELDESKKTRMQYIEQKKYYDILGTILNDKGIKTRIIRKYLPVINNHVNMYLKDMDFFVNFQLDENFQETIKSRHRDDFSYYSFSEGEKKRIDIALLLTWRYIAAMRNSVNVNLLILDEVFDASLDQAGVDDLMKLFHLLDKTNLFIISHKLDVLDDKFPAKITVEKFKNFTTMEYR